jgi:thioredoxin reductase (NADPH)
VVVGGGNSAIEEALYLAGLASEVTIVHRRDHFRAEKILQDRVFKHPKINVRWNEVIDEICGHTDPLGVTHVRLKNVLTSGVEEVPTEGVFVAIGHQPATDLFRDQLVFKPNGYIQTAPNSTHTSVEGVFAAGDVADDIYRQAVTAAGMGCMAALDVERWLAARN